MSIRFPLLFSAICLIALFTSPAEAQPGKKPGGGTTLPNVRFEVRFLGTLGGASYVEAMNEHAQIVGYSTDSQGVVRATRFTEFGAVDLNVEMADLLSARSDGPWIAWAASDINDLGQIVGYIKIPGGKTQPFFYDPGDSGLGRRLDILPHLYGTTTKAQAVNNWGQIVGYYEANGVTGAFVYTPGGNLVDMGNSKEAIAINDVGQVVFSSVDGNYLRYTPTVNLGDAGTYTAFPFYCSSNSINFFGDLAGSSRISLGKNKYEYTAYRAVSPNALEVLYRIATTRPNGAGAGCINDDRDTSVANAGRPSLYTNMNNIGLLQLDPIVVGTPSALTKWREQHASVKAMTNRRPIGGTSSFPVMAGMAGVPSQAFVLSPRLP